LDQKKAIERTMASRLEEAKTQLEVAKANVGQAQAEVNVSQTQALNMDQDLKRFEGLDPRARSQQQLDNATAQQRMTAATVEQSQAKVTAAQAQASNAQAAVMTAQSDIAKAAADRHQAEIQLGYCTITAPQDGVITRKNVEAGMYLSAGDPMFSIVPSDVWVAANFKETQLNRIRVGQPVDVLVDAYPGKIYHGTLQSIQSGTGSRFTLLPPENATGNYVKVVQRVPVKIVLDAAEMADPARPLSPGMSAIPKIKVAERQNFSEVIREWFKG
jgi:membrane fusion protein (multidrug efflux system)